MELVKKGEAVDIDATFQLLDKRISALEPNNKVASADWKPGQSLKTEQPVSSWKPETTKRA
jgi:hypothetical protein